jgi:sulfoxide reductase heme-binding subunit YedZ
MDVPPLANILGFIALLVYLITLLPSILKTVFPFTKESGIPQWLLKHRRLIGISAFLFALFHGFLIVKKRNLDFWDLKTFCVYIQGVSTFIIFTILAATSNNYSIKKLKKNWKKLHSLTYLAMFLLSWHIWDKMLWHWTYVTFLGFSANMIIIILFFLRLKINYQNQQQKLNR